MNDLYDSLKSKFDISPELESVIRRLIIERQFRRGDTISALPELTSHMFYINSGSARVFYVSGGKYHTYSFAFENEFVSLSHPLLNHPELMVTIEFLQPSTVSMLPFDKLHNLFHDYDRNITDKVLNVFIRGMIGHISSLEERVLMLQTLSAPERYRWLINTHPEILGRATLTQIASYLGVTKETIYRIRSGKY